MVRARRGEIERSILDFIVEDGEGYGLGFAKALGIGYERYSSIKAALKNLLDNCYIYEDRVEKGFRSRRVFYKPTLLGVATYLVKKTRKWMMKKEQPSKALEEMFEILTINQHLCPVLLKKLNKLKEKKLFPMLFHPRFLRLAAELHYSRLRTDTSILGVVFKAIKTTSTFIRKYQEYINYEAILSSAMLFCFTNDLKKQGEVELFPLLKQGFLELIMEDEEFRNFHLSYLTNFLKLERDLSSLKEAKKRAIQGDYKSLAEVMIAEIMPISYLFLREEMKS